MQAVEGSGGGLGMDGGVDRFQISAQPVPILLGGKPEGVADQVDQTGLHDRGRPYRVDAVGQALQAVTDQEEHIRDTTVA